MGKFRIGGLTPMERQNELLCRMSLDLDGILHVSATEELTGLAKQIRIENALRAPSPDELDGARERLRVLHGRHADDMEEEERELEPEEGLEESDAPDERDSVLVTTATVRQAPAGDGAVPDPAAPARELLARSRALLERMNDDDREDAIDLNEQLELAISAGDRDALSSAHEELKELLFFVEGR